LRVRPEPTQVKHLVNAPVYAKLLALLTNIILGRKDFTRTNTRSYCVFS
jgi:hypothetical protein